METDAKSDSGMPHRAAAMKITGERVGEPGGRLQPDLAAARRRLRPGGAGSCRPGTRARPRLRRRATATTCSPRGRRSASTSTAEALAGQERDTVVADMRELPFGDGEFDSVLVGPVARARARPRAGGRRGRRACSGPAASPCSSPRTGSPSGRPDEIIDPYHYVEFDRRRARRLCCAATSARSRSRDSSARRATWRSSTRSARRSTGSCARDPLRLRRLVPDAGPSNGSTT